MTHDDQIIAQIMALIEERSGLILSDNHRTVDARRVILSTVTTLNLENLDALYQQLQQRDQWDATWQTLLQELTIGETYFFRNQAHFEALRNDILPQMIARKRATNQRWLRIWSAGCSTGEEIYSLAILIRELLPDYKEWAIYLIGTDINEAYITQAKQAFYRINSFRGETPANLADRWFKKHGRVYELNSSIRDMVLFRSLNLVTDSYPTADGLLLAMDMILCQNVTIYFDRVVTESVQTRLVDTLANDGWLILGHSEPLYIKTPLLALQSFPNAVVYKRQSPPVLAALEPAPKQRPVPLAPPKERRNSPAPEKLPPSVERSNWAKELCQQAQEVANNQRWDEALSLLDTVLKSHALYEHAHYLRGLIYMEQKEFHKSMASLRQALYCNPYFVLAHYLLGELYNRMGYSEKARREWQNTQALLANMQPHELIPYTTDLSVEMLHGLLTTQLSTGGDQ